MNIRAVEYMFVSYLIREYAWVVHMYGIYFTDCPFD